MTDRFIPPLVQSLRPFVDAGVMGMAEVHVVATFAAAVGPEVLPDDVVLAAALAVRGPLHGHVCVDLSDVADSVVPHERAQEPTAETEVDPEGRDDEGSELDLPALAADVVDGPDPVSLPWPDPFGWAERLLASPLARAETDEPSDLVEPLVVRGTFVYLDRYWRDERAVAADLLGRARTDLVVDDASLAALDAYLPESDAGADLQRRAGLAALQHQLVVIAGGPGTGKTRTVARLLAVLASGRPTAEGGPVQIALAAPTGKAAARLGEAITTAVQEADPPPEVAARLAELEARTVHRLLGSRAGGASFRHDASNPIAADVVVVDEVSMVSLPLMARLLDAVRPEARVVLVGDPFQLASVEAGAVLGDVVGTRGGPAPAGVRGNVVTLDRVYRFQAGSAIAVLAAAINSGDADAVIDLLRHGPTGTGGSVVWVEPDRTHEVDSTRDGIIHDAVQLVDAARDGDVAAALTLLGSSKVLCATRRGPLGVQDWNQSIEQRLRATGRMRTRWSAGRPVMVTANDYLNGVFNGDVGVVVRPAAGPAGDRRVQVAFEGPEGPRLLDPSRLDRVETQWAMTIHKSQGSEFSHVVVTLPPPPSPILTRELLYTAVTRAKERVTLVASEAAVRAAVERPVTRSSGLAERLA